MRAKGRAISSAVRYQGNKYAMPMAPSASGPRTSRTGSRMSGALCGLGLLSRRGCTDRLSRGSLVVSAGPASSNRRMTALPASRTVTPTNFPSAIRRKRPNSGEAGSSPASARISWSTRSRRKRGSGRPGSGGGEIGECWSGSVSSTVLKEDPRQSRTSPRLSQCVASDMSEQRRDRVGGFLLPAGRSRSMVFMANPFAREGRDGRGRAPSLSIKVSIWD